MNPEEIAILFADFAQDQGWLRGGKAPKTRAELEDLARAFGPNPHGFRSRLPLPRIHSRPRLALIRYPVTVIRVS